MGKDREMFDLIEEFTSEIDPGHPGHEIEIPETAQPLFYIGFYKIFFTTIFFLPLFLENQELVENGFFFTFDL